MLKSDGKFSPRITYLLLSSLILIVTGSNSFEPIERAVKSVKRTQNFQPAIASIDNKLQATQTFPSPTQQSSLLSLNRSQLKATPSIGSTKNQIKPLIQAAGTNVNGPNGATGEQSTNSATSDTNNIQRVLKQQANQINVANSIGSSGVQKFNGNVNNQDDPITYLDYSSINDEVLRKNAANFVYFNANFNQCRHCYRFFNIWKDLALDIRWWRQIIRLYTINCSDEDNIEMCRRAGVTQFPQVKYYWVMSNSLDQDGQRLRILGKSVHAMRHLIMDKVLDSYLEHNKLISQRAAQRSSNSAFGNPLAALMPMLGQLMGQPSSTTGGSSGLASIIGMLTGKSAGGSGGLPSFGTLLNQIGGFQGLSQMINALSSAASMRKSLAIQPLPKNWPELDQIVVSDTQRLLSMLPVDPSKGVGALLIMETQEFLYTGLEVMLDLNPYSNSTYVVRVRDERSQLSKNLTSRDDIQAPALIYVTENREPRLIMAAPKYTNDEDLRRAFVKAFDRKQVKYPLKRVWTTTNNNNQIAGSTSETSQDNEELLERLNNVYMGDLTNALRSSLMEQVFRHPDLTDDQYNALVRYVYVLINYFPFNNDESLKFVRRLHSWLQNQVSPMDISDYKKQFHDVDEAIEKREWVACRSLSNTKAMPSRNKKSGMLFDNPAQFGKIVSNITRLFRTNQQKAGQLKNLLSIFSGSTGSSPVMLSNYQQNNNTMARQQSISTRSNSTIAPLSTSKPSHGSTSSKDKKDESPLERIVKSLTSGSLGSDSSILKLISTALTGGGGADGDQTSTGSKSKYAREYPCGAWKLAHVMVVNEYIKDSPRKDVKHIVLHSLHQYMLHFYACPTCGNRVSDVTGEFRINLEDHLVDQSDSIMLVWKVHNKINKRLESELRPGSPPKQQFPSETLCPKCRGVKAQNDLVSTPNWHEKQVLNFLVHHYRPQSIIASDDVSSSDSSSSATLFKRPVFDRSTNLVQGLCLAAGILTGYFWPPQIPHNLNRL